ncbi:MAG: acetyltransferase [Oscillospiraceae bacterium]|nr:acetyltransferase [Oscillospiraceae bacterium]
MKNVIIIGTGGHAKVLADIVLCSGDNLMGFLTSDTDKTQFVGYPILGLDTDYKNFENCSFIIGIGDNAAREKIAERMQGVDWYTAIHPTAIIARIDTSIGEGSAILANATVCAGAHIGRHCIINTSADADHDTVMEDFSHISALSILAGGARIGKRSFMGVNSCVRDKTSIGDDCFIGAGSAVVKDITEPGVYVGVPVRKIK